MEETVNDAIFRIVILVWMLLLFSCDGILLRKNRQIYRIVFFFILVFLHRRTEKNGTC